MQTPESSLMSGESGLLAGRSETEVASSRTGCYIFELVVARCHKLRRGGGLVTNVSTARPDWVAEDAAARRLAVCRSFIGPVCAQLGVPTAQEPRTSHNAHSGPPPSRVLDRPVSFLITVPPTEFQNPASEAAAASSLVRLLNRALAARKMVGRQAGVLLVFASGPESAIDQAISTAKSVIGLVRRKVPGFSQVSSAGYWNGVGNYFKFEIFFFSRSARTAS